MTFSKKVLEMSRVMDLRCGVCNAIRKHEKVATHEDYADTSYHIKKDLFACQTCGVVRVGELENEWGHDPPRN